MNLDDIFDRIRKEAPLPSMARIALTHVFQNEAVDEIFRAHASRQYEGDLAFSAVVNLMLPVACRIRPSVNSAFKQYGDSIGVSVTSVYNKLQGIETDVTRAIVRETARSMEAVAVELGAGATGPFPGYATRILDGSHLEASHHRIKETRKSSAAPLPGVGLVVLDPASRRVLDYIPCEDAHAQERSLLPDLIDDLEAGQVWIADRNFCTSAFLWQLEVSRSFFVIRKHATNVVIEACGPEKTSGTTDTGDLFEQPIDILDDYGNRFRARRIRLVLNAKTRDGDREIVILSNLPNAITAEQIASGYRERWSIESAFGEIRRCLNGEINALGYPKAALFSFAMALVSFNLLSLIEAAIGAEHGPEAQENFSTQQAAVEIQCMWSGTTIVLDGDFWTEKYKNWTPHHIAAELKRLASLVDLKKFRKYKTRKRSAKPNRTHDPGKPHVATARLLKQRK